LLQGDNAQGKTNLLEAICYLATANSLRAEADRQLINWLAAEEDIPFARLDAQVQKGDSSQRIEIALIEKPNQGLSKHIRLNGVAKRSSDLIGQVNVILFTPWDVELVAGPPSERRRHLDDVLCQINTRYRRSLRQYNHLLRQRNHLLKSLSEHRGDQSRLLFWDQKLAEEGAYIMACRQRLLAELDGLARPIHLKLTGGKEHLCLRYEPSFDPRAELPQPPLDFASTPLTAEEIAAAFRKHLQRTRKVEIQQGMTLIGPQRDDLRFLMGGMDMNIFGSRGQQRTIALALKLAEVELLHREMGVWPILLLDEVMSELDEARRRYLMEAIEGVEQAILTTTDWNDYRADFLAKATLWQVHEGRIQKMTNGNLAIGY
ncbi:MAG: DNA replication/repair protein RecF, partial [Chloroflexota bacterium]|nr:DNA replication/repair protein RecF [Chloroflexota bacterium]